MLNPLDILKIFKKNNIDFFTGVPDSVIKSLSAELEKKNSKNHVISTNEGSAVGIGIGYHLMKGKIPCIYMQNSGLGNAINPLISIAHKNVYSIPLLLLIGWRGAPNQKDEPQHELKGKITLDLLKLLNIKYLILNNKNDLKKIKNIIKFSKKKSVPVAILIKKDILKPIKKKLNKGEKNYILRNEFIELFLNKIDKNSKLISTTGYTSRELNQVRKNKKFNKGKDFYMVGGMGHSATVALGCSLLTKKQTICLDGDGSLLMHLGSLRTIGAFSRKNFKHILFNNNSHESVGGQKTFADGINFENLTKSLGYKKYFQLNNKKYLNQVVNRFLKSNGPSFLEVKISTGSLEDLSRPKKLYSIKKFFMSN